MASATGNARNAKSGTGDSNAIRAVPDCAIDVAHSAAPVALHPGYHQGKRKGLLAKAFSLTATA